MRTAGIASDKEEWRGAPPFFLSFFLSFLFTFVFFLLLSTTLQTAATASAGRQHEQTRTRPDAT